MKAVLALTVWIIIMGILLLMPIDTISVEKFTIFDKLIHAALFGILSFLILNGIKNLKFLSYLLTIFSSSVYGVFIECMQSELNTGRNFDKFDIIANIIGSMIGSYIFYLLRKLKS